MEGRDVTNGIRAHVIQNWAVVVCAHCINDLLLNFFLFFFTDLCCVVYSGAGMAEGEEIYVDLCDEDNTPDPNAPVMAMLHSLQ